MRGGRPDALARLTRGRAIKCDIKGTDAAGRTSGICFDGATDIGAALVKGGHAFAEQGFLSHAMRARTRRRRPRSVSGAARRNGRRAFVRARGKRRSGRLQTAARSRARSPAARKRLRAAWSPDYGRVRVSKSRGGRWFCSEQEAIAAGWRRSSGLAARQPLISPPVALLTSAMIFFETASIS